MKPLILVVDDDQQFIDELEVHLSMLGYQCILARSVSSALTSFENRTEDFKFIVIDMFLPMEDQGRSYLGMGTELARMLRRAESGLCLLGVSSWLTPEAAQRISGVFDAFIDKQDLLSTPPEIRKRLERAIGRLVGGDPKATAPKLFLAHASKAAEVAAVRAGLEKALGSVVILEEQPSEGTTVIEKFSTHADDVDIAVILFTPDDSVLQGERLQSVPRQNVVFEAGYFMGRFGRLSGRVIVLTVGAVQVPSQLAGLVVIDITNGISNKIEELRREMRRTLSR